MTNDIPFTTLLENRVIGRIYTGLEAGCRCGCHGRYFEPGTVGFTRALNKARKLNPIVTETDDYSVSGKLINEQTLHDYDGKVTAHAYRYANVGSDGVTEWIDICDGNGKTITLYLKN